MTAKILTGGCLCGDLRWKAHAPPKYMGLCYCADCRRASGSAFSPFMGFDAAAITITGRWTVHTVTHADGRSATRNSCVVCGGLVFGGELGKSDEYNIYAGSLDDAAQFKPTVALFVRDKPDWIDVPVGLRQFETLP